MKLRRVVIAALQVVITTMANVASAVGDAVHLVSSQLKGEWSQTFTAALNLVNHVFGGLPQYISGVMGRLVGGIREWMITKLSAIWDT